jgi:hypothetical protein
MFPLIISIDLIGLGAAAIALRRISRIFTARQGYLRLVWYAVRLLAWRRYADGRIVGNANYRERYYSYAERAEYKANKPVISDFIWIAVFILLIIIGTASLFAADVIDNGLLDSSEPEVMPIMFCTLVAGIAAILSIKTSLDIRFYNGSSFEDKTAEWLCCQSSDQAYLEYAGFEPSAANKYSATEQSGREELNPGKMLLEASSNRNQQPAGALRRAVFGASAAPPQGSEAMKSISDQDVLLVALKFNDKLQALKMIGIHDRERWSSHLSLPEPTTVIVQKYELAWWVTRLQQEGYHGDIDYTIAPVLMMGQLSKDERARLRKVAEDSSDADVSLLLDRLLADAKERHKVLLAKD